MNIPSQITAGDTIEWIDSLPAYSPDLFTLNWALRNKTGSSLDLLSIADDQDFKTTITGSQSASLKQGPYNWQAWVIEIETGDRTTVGGGVISVCPNLQDPNYDPRSQTEKDLEAVEEAIRVKMAGGAVQSYKIKGREMQYFTLTELQAYKKDLARAVVAEKRAAGQYSSTVGIEFTRHAL